MTTATNSTKTIAQAAESEAGGAEDDEGGDLEGRSMPCVEFCGEILDVTRPLFTVGRNADLVLDADNRFLHRKFLMLRREQDLWFIVNVGGGTIATISNDTQGIVTTLGPGAALPLTERLYRVGFVAGPTRYEFEVRMPGRLAPSEYSLEPSSGDRTMGRVALTPDQKLLILSLAEPVLRSGQLALLAMPTSHQAAQRLGWTITKFNRKLDNVCQKFTRLGVRGLHGEVGNLACQRRVRLVEHAVSSRTVTPDDLALLEDARRVGTDA